MPVGSERDSDHRGAVGLRCGAGCGSVAAMETTHRRPRPQGVRPLPERAGAETLGQGESPAAPPEKQNLFLSVSQSDAAQQMPEFVLVTLLRGHF